MNVEADKVWGIESATGKMKQFTAGEDIEFTQNTISGAGATCFARRYALLVG